MCPAGDNVSESTFYDKPVVAPPPEPHDVRVARRLASAVVLRCVDNLSTSAHRGGALAFVQSPWFDAWVQLAGLDAGRVRRRCLELAAEPPRAPRRRNSAKLERLSAAIIPARGLGHPEPEIAS